jgi:hypothetical protein
LTILRNFDQPSTPIGAILVRKYNFVWAAFVALWLAFGPTLADAKPTARKTGSKPTAQKKDPIKDLATFLVLNSVDSEDANLFEACRYTAPKGLLWSLDDVLEDWDFSKREFETTAEYDLRMKKLEDTLNNGRLIVVCKKISEDSNFIKYDADQRLYDVSGFSVKHIDDYSKDTGSYVSRTRMGVKARVYASFHVNYDLSVGDSYGDVKTFGCYSKSYFSFQFPVELQKAQSLRQSGYLVMVGRLKKPFYTKSESNSKPTLDSPFDEHTLTLTLEFNPVGIYLVDVDGRRFSCS